MASFPIGTTPFLLEIYSAWGSSVQDIPRTPIDAADEEAGRYLPIQLICAPWLEAPNAVLGPHVRIQKFQNNMWLVPGDWGTQKCIS